MSTPKQPQPEHIGDMTVEMRLRALRALSTLLPMMALLYTATGVLFLVTPPFEPASECVAISSVSAAFSLILWGTIRPDDPRLDTPVALCTIAIASGMALSTLAVSGQLINTTTLTMGLVAGGAFLYRFSLYAVLVVVTFAGWFPLAHGHSDPEFALWLFYLIAASLLGGLTLWFRQKLITRLHLHAQEAEAMGRLATEQAAKLERARDIALASAQAKGQFLANVSHEVRTPLNGILGLLQLIEANHLPKPQDEYLREVNLAGRSLLAIVNDLLDLSKIEAGRVAIESVPFDVVSMIEEVVANHASAATAKDIELLTDVEERLPDEVCGDPLRLRQVITNLVSNAIKFTRNGEVAIAARTVDLGPSHADLEFRVSDTGVGIPADKRETIFHPFLQGDPSTTRKYGGTGLGLAICRELVELMGGTLQMRSMVGRGSTFYFTIRLELEERLSRELAIVSEALAGMQVMLLEANHRARATRASQLQSWGMVVSQTTTIDGALQLVNGSPRMNLALIDLRSLGTGWRRKATALQQAAAEVGCTVVALASHTHDAERVRKTGIQVHLQKPVRRAKLISALLEALNLEPIKPDPHIRSVAATVTDPHAAPPVAHGMRVLVAEDNPINLRVIDAHLRALGYDVDAVADGRAALDALGPDHRYAAVIMDGQMPNMDGYQATRLLREREAQTQQLRVPVIALTAHAMTGDRRAALAAGMDDYLSKPFTQNQLHKTLTRWAARPAVGSSEFPPDALDTQITAQLLDLEEDRPGFLAEVIDSFFRSAEDNLSKMREATANADLELLRSSAHKIKGSSQQLGARRFGSTCEKLEALDSVDGASTLLNDLERELESARRALTGLADRALDAAS